MLIIHLLKTFYRNFVFYDKKSKTCYHMKRSLFLSFFYLIFTYSCRSQQVVTAAKDFINTLDSAQKTRALYPFDVDERYSFHYFPIEDRKGISFNELSSSQRQAAKQLIKTCLSENAAKKVDQIMELENVLKAVENRKADDHYRDPGKYFLIIFGVPADNTTWGWRLEGHHVSFHFSAKDKKLVSGTPGFLGANPAVVRSGTYKGLQVLKEETEMGFALLHSLTQQQLKKAVIDTTAPGEIITFVSRKAIIEHPAGVFYSEMTSKQQEQFLALVNLYVHRYTKLFADEMLKEIQQAGLNNLRFAWAGYNQPDAGKPCYYRIQGPTIIIEYDNSQNNANHIHSVLRDLKNDFGGDLLLEHYKSDHSNKQ